MIVHSPKAIVTLIGMIGSCFSLPLSGQAPSSSPQSVVGTVINLDSGGRTIRIKNDQGQELFVGLRPSASFSPRRRRANPTLRTQQA